MSSITAAGGPASKDNKQGKKRKTNVEVATSTSTGGSSPAPDSHKQTAQMSEQALDGINGGPGESAYLKELNKNIRNIHKKLAACAKTDSVIAENPGLSLDELVALRKLNTDQKAQALKKPGLQTQLAQFEEQLTQYRTFGQEYEERFAQEKAGLIAAHDAQIAQAKGEAIAETHQIFASKHDQDLLVLSQFLHAAAAKRQSEDADSEEGRAFEGALLLVYQGNQASLTTLKNLVDGTDDKVPDTQGELLHYTFAQVKQASMDHAPAFEEGVGDELAEAEDVPDETAAIAPKALDTDPTIAHAGMTELEDTAIMPSVNTVAVEAETVAGPEQMSTTGEAANAVAESNWDPQASMTTSDSAGGDGWVEVPRDPAETDTGITATPAAMHGSSNWAEEVTEGAAADEKAAAENDGFEQVIHHQHRGRGRGRGEMRGRGGRGDRGGRTRGDGDGRRGGRGRGRGDGTPRGGTRGARGT